MGMAVHVQTCEIYALKPLVIMLDFPFLRSGMGGFNRLHSSFYALLTYLTGVFNVRRHRYYRCPHLLPGADGYHRIP